MKNILYMILFVLSMLNANENNLVIKSDTNNITNEITKLLSRAFYRKDAEQIEAIYNVYLNKTNIIAFEYYDNKLEKNTYSIVKKDGKTIFKLSLLDNNIYKNIGYVQTVPIVYKNIKLGFLFIYYKNRLDLNIEEKKFLKQKSNIRVCVQKNNMPNEDIVNNNLIGINSDFLKRIEQDFNVSTSLVQVKTYKEKIESLKNNRCDMAFGIIESSNKNILLSKVYLEDNMAIATLLDKKYIKSVDNISSHSIGIILHEDNQNNILMRIYDKLHFYLYSTIDDGVNALEKGKIYGLFDYSNNLAYSIKNRYFKNIKLNGDFKDLKIKYHIAVSSSQPLLISSLNKVIDNYNYDQILNIISKWINIDQDKKIDWDFIRKIFIFIVIVGVFLIYRHYILYVSNKKLKIEVQKELEKNIKKDKIIAYQTRLAIIGEMLNNIAHQWRQPLNEINSLLITIDYTMMKEKIFSKDIEEKLQAIENQTQYMSNTIDDFRDYFNPNKQKTEFTFEEVVQKSLNIFSGTISKYDINIEKIVYNDKKHYNYMSELVQIIITILNNAKDALVLNKIQDPKIIIKIREDLICIEDNGGGIDPNNIDKIFNPYFTTKGTKKGTGIGLYLCRMIVEDSLQGSIGVKNIENGAKFMIKFKKEDYEQKI
jgi:signal transduction histidine kinase